VVPGSAVVGGDPCRVAFKLAPSWYGSVPEPPARSIDVVYQGCDLPYDMPNWRLELAVDGRVANDGGKRSIAAERVLAKCPAKYCQGDPCNCVSPEWLPCGFCQAKN
jgi:hypothetical protein